MGRREQDERKRKAAAKTCQSLDNSGTIKKRANPDIGGTQKPADQSAQNEGRFPYLNPILLNQCRSLIL